MVRVVDPEILDWAGWKYGHDIAFGDPEFWPWLDKQDNFSGVFRVRHRRVKDGVGWTPPQADPRPTGIVIREAGHKRFTKHYPS